MSTESTKQTVLQKFLHMASQYFPLSSGHFATMGGEGIEARLWQSSGVAPDNGWLIERGRSLSQQLIRELPYRYCSNLSSFPTVFSAVCGQGVGVDAFHLDLCGTLEANLDTFELLLPLIACSQGRCLAITVADQRRNRTLEFFDELKDFAKRLLGDAVVDQLFEHILAEQQRLAEPEETTFNPEKGARREFGVLFHFIRLLLKRREGVSLPDRIERCVYLSRYGSKSFRMRTYMFHFANPVKLEPKEVTEHVSDLWRKSPLWVVHPRISVRVQVYPNLVSHPSQGEAMQEFPKLKAIALAVGGDVAQEFNTLLAQATATASLQERIQVALQALQITAVSDNSRDTPLVVQAPVAAPAPSPNNSSVIKQKVLIQLNLLRAAVKGDSALHLAYEQAYHELGLTSRKHTSSRARTVGGLKARTAGEFRPNFVKRVVQTLGVDILNELSQLYTQLTNEDVSVAKLKAEAGL